MLRIWYLIVKSLDYRVLSCLFYTALDELFRKCVSTFSFLLSIPTLIEREIGIRYMKNINQLCLLTLSRYNKTEQRYKPETQNGLWPISMSIFRS